MADRKAMGIGVIGQPDIVFKRKFRWTFEILGFCDNEKNVVPEHFVTVASRPNLEVEETEINHLNAKTWIPGKASWQTISVTYLDVAHPQMQSLWNWLATVYDFTDPVNLRQGERADWDATGLLSLYDGCGVLLESWQLQRMFPTGIDFGDMDYSASDIATIELTLRYSDVKYRSYCPDFQPTPCCGGCGTTVKKPQFASFI
jgi:hypothetical protein